VLVSVYMQVNVHNACMHIAQ